MAGIPIKLIDSVQVQVRVLSLMIKVLYKDHNRTSYTYNLLKRALTEFEAFTRLPIMNVSLDGKASKVRRSKELVKDVSVEFEIQTMYLKSFTESPIIGYVAYNEDFRVGG
jgi:hypothetical protein